MSTLRQILAAIRSFDYQMPVPVFEMVEMLGLGPTLQKLPDNISGMIVRSPTAAAYTIIVNENHHPNRQRFTAAHELGHYMFHRELLNMGVGDTLAYRAQDSGYPNQNIGSMQETEANRFASNLLMPNNLIAKLRAEGVTAADELARRLGVSEAAMRIKLGLPPKTPLFG